jgi:hypothetical protein
MRIVGAALAALSLSGCALVMAVSDASGTTGREVEEAIDHGDYARLGKVCSGEESLNRNHKSAQERACNELARKEALEASCEDAVARLDKVRNLDRDWRYHEAVAATMKKLAGCGRYRELFERLPYRAGAGAGFDALDDGRMPLVAELARYVDASGAGFLAAPGAQPDQRREGMRTIAEWLVRKQHLDQCEPMVRAASASADLFTFPANDYFVAAGCAASAPLFAAMLRDESADRRKWACEALAKVGAAEQLGAIGALADADPVVDVVERRGYAVRVYPVRDACAHARAQIQLRASGSSRLGGVQ